MQDMCGTAWIWYPTLSVALSREYFTSQLSSKNYWFPFLQPTPWPTKLKRIFSLTVKDAIHLSTSPFFQLLCGGSLLLDSDAGSIGPSLAHSLCGVLVLLGLRTARRAYPLASDIFRSACRCFAQDLEVE